MKNSQRKDKRRTKKCPLCKNVTSIFVHSQKETVLDESAYTIIVRTKTLKGHKERIMVVAKAHKAEVPYWLRELALARLEEVGKRVFNYTPKFVIMDGTFASIKDHWHLVATDLDPKAEDFEQILKTKWLKVIDTDE